MQHEGSVCFTSKTVNYNHQKNYKFDISLTDILSDGLTWLSYE